MSTPVRPRVLGDRAAGARAGARREALIGSMTVVVALVLVLVDAPVPVRLLIALPVLVLVPGTSAVRLLMPGSAEGTARGDEDPVLRSALAVVLGTLFLLASALVVAVLGVRIDTVSVAVSTALGSLVLLGVAAWRHPGAATFVRQPDPGPVSRRPGTTTAPRLRRAAGGLLAVGVLVAALVGAQALQTPRVEKYTALTFDDPRMLQPDPLAAAPGADVALPWTLRSFGRSLSDTGASVVVTVGAVPAADPRSRIDPVRGADGTGSTAEQSGSVTFSAPVDPGLYQVDLIVLSDGVSYLLVTHLEVRR